MKEHAPAMQVAVPVTTPPVSPPYLQRKHAVLLVAGVLLMHLWLLAGGPMWFTPEPGEPLHPKAMVTRQIEVAAMKKMKAALAEYA